MNPRVFISHASEDKERFVIDFATKLRKKGIDAWIDKWEILLGDSLVEKVFEEGIKNANAIIIVLSDNSINKPWVKNELDASIVERLERGTRIIPIVLDRCNIPHSLKSTKWQSITDLDDYSGVFHEIVSSIYNRSDKPKLGNIPSYISANIKPIIGITDLANQVLIKTCEYVLTAGNWGTSLQSEDLVEFSPDLELTQEEIDDSIEILEGVGYIHVQRALSGNYFYSLTNSGFHVYAEQYLDEYENNIKTVINLIVNEKLTSNIQIIEISNLSPVIIDGILLKLRSSCLLKLTISLTGLKSIHNVSSRLKQMIDALE